MIDLRKPEKGSGRDARKVRAAERRAEKRKAQRAEDAKLAAHLKQIRIDAFLRDHRRCRAFGTRLLLTTDNLFKLAECHHIVFKSHGGSDELHNRVTLSVKAHRMIHDGALEVSGDPGSVLTFRSFIFDGGTRRLLREWQSAS